MGIRYEAAPDVARRVRSLIGSLGLPHDPGRVLCIRSRGSRARRILARCHALAGAMQAALGVPPAYAIEVVAERFDRLDEPEQTRTLIHELLHIPAAFGGGFRGHGYVTRRRVEDLYRILAAGAGPRQELIPG